MRIEDDRYLCAEAVVYPLTKGELLPFNVGMVHMDADPIELSVCIDFTDVKYIQRGYDANGASDCLCMLVMMDGENITLCESFEEVFKAYMNYKNKWEIVNAD